MHVRILSEPQALPLSQVTTLDLDRSLAQVLKAAQSMPVAVHRYGKPWVWLVSHETWLKTAHWQWAIPENHPLAALRAHLDAQMAAHVALLRQLAQAGEHSVQAVIIAIRAMILRLVYGIESIPYLLEQLRFNALFVSFVGLDGPREGLSGLQADLMRYSNHAVANELIERLLERAPLERFAQLGLSAQPMRGSRLALCQRCSEDGLPMMGVGDRSDTSPGTPEDPLARRTISLL